MPNSTPFSTQCSLLQKDTESLLLAHSLSAHRYHDDCRRQYRWNCRVKDLAEWIDSLLSQRFATTLVLMGVPALAIAALV